MKLIKPICSSRLLLRTLKENDAMSNYKKWVNTKAVNRYLEFRHDIPSSNGLMAFIKKMNESPENLLLGIFLDKNNHIGNIKLGPINWCNKRGIIGIMIGEQTQWGKGHAAEAIESLSNYAFEHLGLNSIRAGCYAENIASYKAFIKAGYKEEGRQYQYWKTENGFSDNILLGKVCIYEKESITGH